MHKVLLIAYYWPPAGGPGVQRWLKFVKYLRDFGVDPIVYVPDNPHYPIVDDNLVTEVPKGIRIIRRPIREPYRWASFLSKTKTKTISSGIIKEKNPSLVERLLLWVRGNLFIPDARKFWIKPSVRYLSEILKEEGISTIITTGPPHSLHLIGLGLKQIHSLHWIADFRDPWTSIGYHSKLRLSNWAAKKHVQLEQQVLQGADRILVTSRTTKVEFQNITSKPIEVITNGFDETRHPAKQDDDFTISHLGSLLTGRNPISLWKVLQELISENESFKSHLKIQLAGVVGAEVWDSIVQYGLEPFVMQLGYVPHAQVLEIQQKSQVLLLLEIDAEETRGIIPGKLFEYLNAKRPILALGPKAWEAGAIIMESNAGKVLEHNNTKSLKSVLLDWFGKYEEGTLRCDSKGIEQYHRKELTKQLANYITWESS